MVCLCKCCGQKSNLYDSFMLLHWTRSFIVFLFSRQKLSIKWSHGPKEKKIDFDRICVGEGSSYRNKLENIWFGNEKKKLTWNDSDRIRSKSRRLFNMSIVDLNLCHGGFCSFFIQKLQIDFVCYTISLNQMRAGRLKYISSHGSVSFSYHSSIDRKKLEWKEKKKNNFYKYRIKIYNQSHILFYGCCLEHRHIHFFSSPKTRRTTGFFLSLWPAHKNIRICHTSLVENHLLSFTTFVSFIEMKNVNVSRVFFVHEQNFTWNERVPEPCGGQLINNAF